MISTSTQRRASVFTLGCRLNQSESQHLRDRLERSGYSLVPFGAKADLGIINTCTVTRTADAKCRQVIRQFVRRNPNAFTAVVGCYSQMDAAALAEIPGVDLIVGNQEKMNVLSYAGLGKNPRPLIIRDRIERSDFSIVYHGDRPFTRRANLKIQDGCDFVCSFCIIPFARGRSRSRDFLNLVEEARNLEARGVKELVLTGVNLGTYCNSGFSIVDVVDQLNLLPGIERIRISSIEPTTIPWELCHRMRDRGHALLPYLHIPLQSGSDRILKLMRRRYRMRDITQFIENVHDSVPNLCIGTDLMVGFPGETAADFGDTCSAFLELPFAYCHVFPYSERAGTTAARRSDHIPVTERSRRSAMLRRLSAQKRHDFYLAHVGKTMEVLFEDCSAQRWPGYTGNYIRVVCQSSADLTNRRGRVKLEGVGADIMQGTLTQLLD